MRSCKYIKIQKWSPSTQELYIDTLKLSWAQRLVFLSTILPVKMWMCEGASRLYGNHIHRLHRIFKRQVRVHCPEAAEIMSPNQQCSGLMHGVYIQLSVTNKTFDFKRTNDATPGRPVSQNQPFSGLIGIPSCWPESDLSKQLGQTEGFTLSKKYF